MSFIQARDIIEQNRREHLTAAGLMEDLCESFSLTRVRQLAEHMQKQQQEMAKYLGNFHESSSEGLLNSWFQYLPETESPLELLKEVEEDLQEEEITSLINRINSRFSKRYHLISKAAPTDLVRETFEQIASLGLHESEQFQWQAVEFYDS